ncbi:MAG: CsbD family protein [Spirochaetia bacterium]
MNDDQIKGRIEEAKGKVKKAAGKAVGNRELEREGKLQNAHGKAQAKFGDLRDGFKEADLDGPGNVKRTSK